jgi:hypothetical protein
MYAIYMYEDVPIRVWGYKYRECGGGWLRARNTERKACVGRPGACTYNRPEGRKRGAAAPTANWAVIVIQ